MSILIFLLVLSVLVFVHELGHLLAAKRSGVRVEEFGFGLPPRIFGRKIGNTLYSINLLPIGGFVKLKGEDAEMAGFGDADSFASIKPSRRIFIVGAGVLGNLFLAYLIFVGLFLVGYPKLSGQVKVSEVTPGSPAAAANVLPGDVVSSFNHQKIETPDDLIEKTNQKRGQEIVLTVERSGQLSEVKVVPRVSPPPGQGPLGVRLGFEGGLVYEKVGLASVPLRAAQEIAKQLGLMAAGLQKMVGGLFVGKVPQEVAGVVGIYKISSQAYEAGLRIFAQFVAVVSLNLFVFNLLPIPALDGGRILFILPELIFKRKVSPKVERMVNNLGLVLLLTLVVLVTIRDVRRF